MRIRLTTVAPLFVFVAAFAGSCNGDKPITGPGTDTKYNLTMTVDPTSVSVPQDDSLYLDVWVIDQDKNDTLNMANYLPINYASADPATADLDQNGVGYVVGYDTGSTTMTVSYFYPNKNTTFTIDVPVTVTPNPVASVSVVGPDTVSVGKTLQIDGYVLNAAGDTLLYRPRTWSVGDTTIATVDASGVVTGVAAGATTVKLTSEGISDSTALVVKP